MTVVDISPSAPVFSPFGAGVVACSRVLDIPLVLARLPGVRHFEQAGHALWQLA